MSQIFKNYSLKPHNTFNIDARAKYFAECNSRGELKNIIDHKIFKREDNFIIGAGSNILFTEDYNGIVVYPNIKGIKILQEDESDIVIKASCGENWDKFVKYCVNNNYGGIENLSWIPGKVGAVPIQNIGAYGVEARDRILEVEALEIETGKIKIFSNEECRFGYRASIFKNKYKGKYIILSVSFRLSKKPELVTNYGSIRQELEKYPQKDIKAIRDIVINIRKNKLPDPDKIGNAGSFFKNPVVSRENFLEIQDKYPDMPYYQLSDNSIKIPAGWMIDKCGWKGKRIDDAGVYSKQALILVNYGNAKGRELYKLSREIEADVEQEFDISLEREVRVIGNG